MSRLSSKQSLILYWLPVFMVTVVCSQTLTPEVLNTRAQSLPSDTSKITPGEDLHPPILHSDEWEDPVPVGGLVNTAGAEDSPFINPDGNTLYFFFTPDVRLPAEQQLGDGVTGIYAANKINGLWEQPERNLLRDAGEVSLDGCEFIQADIMWFCSARLGNFNDIDFWTANLVDGLWTNWENAGEKLNVEYEIGEMHITADGTQLYFHSLRQGGLGDVDIWVTTWVNDAWSYPENVTAINSQETDGWPFVSQDGRELWFLRWYQGTPAIFRSLLISGEWQEPELIISQFAGEPSLDEEGNIYFVHHFFEEGVMLEADIYVAYRR